MSGIPKDIPDFGSVASKPRQNAEFVPGRDFTTEDYYVWSRCDGLTSVRDIILMIGLGSDKTVDTLRKLRGMGAILLEGERPADVAQRLAAATAGAATRSRRRRPTRHDASAEEVEPPPRKEEDLGELSDEEAAAMAQETALDDDEKRRVIAALRRVHRADYFEILGVDRDADRRAIKRAYFRISKEFHPDRHYGREVGSFKPWFKQVFEVSSRAFEVLSDPRARADYEATLRGGFGRASSSADAGQTREEHAAELYARACQLELSGAGPDALKLFAAAIRTVPEPRYLRRAAMCARSAGQLSEAENYAKKAADLRPSDPSYYRVLADVYRAEGRFTDAEATLLRALDLRTENDVLVGELESDLAAVRAALASA